MSNIIINGLTTNRMQSLSSIINNMIYNKSGVNVNNNSAAQNSALATLQSVANNNKIDTSYSSYINNLQTTIDSLNNQSNNVASKITEMSALKSSYSKTATTLDSFLNNIKNSSSNSVYDYTNTNNDAASVELLTSNVTSQRIDYNVMQVATATVATSNVLKGVSVDKTSKIVDLFAGNFDNNSFASTRTDIKGSSTMEQLGVTTGSFEIGGHIISVNDTDTVDNVIEKLRLAGYEAGFNAENKFYISSETESLAIRNQNTNFGEIMGLTVSKGTFSVNGYDINITDSTTVQEILDTINSDEKFGVGASLEGNKIQLVANKTGDVLIEIAKGSSNFTNAIGFTTGGTMRRDNLVVGTEGKYQALTGITDVTSDMTFTAGDFSITSSFNGTDNRVEFQIEEGETLDDVIRKINESSLDINASIKDGKLKLEQNNFGAAYNMTIEAGSSDFTSAVGLTSETESTGLLSPGLDANYFTHLTGTSTITDPNNANAITEGSFKINNKTIMLNAGSVNDAIAKINLYSEETGVIAEIVDDQLVLRNRLTGTDTLFIEGGTSNFGEILGLTTESVSSATSSIGTQGSASTLTGTENININTTVSASAIKINGTIVNIAEGNIVSAIDNINAASTYTSIQASLENGKLVFTEMRNGALPISVEDMSGNFGAITGIIGYTVVAGEEDKFGGTRTKLTTAREVSNAMQISESSLTINGTSMNVSGTIRDAIETINANSVTTGVEAYINTSNQLTFRAIQYGEVDVQVQITGGDLGRVIGMGTYSTTDGSSSQVERIFASLTGCVSGLDEYSQILNGSTLKISTKDFNTGAVTTTDININGATTIGDVISKINAKSLNTGVVARLNDNGEFELMATNDSIRTIGIEVGGTGDFGRTTGLGNYIIMGAMTEGAVSGQTFSSITGLNGVTADMQITDTSFTLHYVNDAGVDVSRTYTFTTGQTLQQVMNMVNTGTLDGTGVDNDWYVRADIIDGKFVFTSRAVGPFDLGITINDNVDGTKGDFGRVIGMASSSAMGFDPTQNRKDAAYIMGGRDGIKLTDQIMGTNTLTIWMTRENALTGVDTQTGSGELASQAVTININPTGDDNMTVGQLIDAINAQASITKVKASLENGQFKLTQIDDLNADDAAKYNTVGGANTAEEGDTIKYTITGTGDIGRVTGLCSYTTGSQPATGSMSAQNYTTLTGATNVTGNETLAAGSIVLTGLNTENENMYVTINISAGETLNSVLDQITNIGVNITANIQDGKVVLTSDLFTDLSISTVGDTDFLRVAGLGKFTIGNATSAAAAATDLGSHSHAVSKSYTKLDGQVANGTLTIDGETIEVIGKSVEEILVNINNKTYTTTANGGVIGQNVARAELDTETGLLTIQINRQGSIAADIVATGDAARSLGIAEYTTTAANSVTGTATDLGSHTHAVSKSYTNLDGTALNGTLTLDGETIEVIGKTVEEILDNINNKKYTTTANGGVVGENVARAELVGDQLTINLNRAGTTEANIVATGDTARILGLGQYSTEAVDTEFGTATDLGTHTHAVTKSYTDLDGKAANGTLTLDGTNISGIIGKSVEEIVRIINTRYSSVARAQIDTATGLLTIQLNREGTTAAGIQATGDVARITGLALYSTTAGVSEAGSGTDLGSHTHAVSTSTIRTGTVVNGTLTLDGQSINVVGCDAYQIRDNINATSVARAYIKDNGELTIQITRNGSTAENIQATDDVCRILGLANYSTSSVSEAGSGTDLGSHTHAVSTSTIRTGTVVNGTLTLDGQSITVVGCDAYTIRDNINATSVARAYIKDNGELTIQITRDGSTAANIQATGDVCRILGIAEHQTGSTSVAGSGTDIGSHTHAYTTSTVRTGSVLNGSLTLDGANISVVGKTAAEIVAEINTNHSDKARANLKDGVLTIQLNRNGSTASNITVTGDVSRILGLATYSTTNGSSTAGSGTDLGTNTHAVSTSTAYLDGKAAWGTLTLDGQNIEGVVGKTAEQIVNIIKTSYSDYAEVNLNTTSGQLTIQIKRAGSTAANISATGDVARLLGIGASSTTAGSAVNETGTDKGTHSHAVITTTFPTGGGVNGVIIDGTLTIDGVSIDVAGKTAQEVWDLIGETKYTSGTYAGQNIASVRFYGYGAAMQLTKEGSTTADVVATGDAARVLGLGAYSTSAGSSAAGSGTDKGTNTHNVSYSTAITTGQVANGSLTVGGKNITVIGKTAEEIMANINTGTRGKYRATLVGTTLTIQNMTAGEALSISASGDAARVLGLADYTIFAATVNNHSSASNNTKIKHDVITTTVAGTSGTILSGYLIFCGQTLDLAGKTVSEAVAAINSWSPIAVSATLTGTSLSIELNGSNCANYLEAYGDAARVLGLSNYTTSSGTKTNASSATYFGFSQVRTSITTTTYSDYNSNPIQNGRVVVLDKYGGIKKSIDLTGKTISQALSAIDCNGIYVTQSGNKLIFILQSEGDQLKAEGHAAAVLGIDNYTTTYGTSGRGKAATQTTTTTDWLFFSGNDISSSNLISGSFTASAHGQTRTVNLSGTRQNVVNQINATDWLQARLDDHGGIYVALSSQYASWGISCLSLEGQLVQWLGGTGINTTTSAVTNITPTTAYLEASTTICNQVASFIGQQGGSFNIYLRSPSNGGSLQTFTINYSAGESINSILGKIAQKSYTYTLDGKTYTGNLSATIVDGKIRINCDNYYNFATYLEADDVSGNFIQLAGLAVGTGTALSPVSSSVNNYKNFITGTEGISIYRAQTVGSVDISSFGLNNQIVGLTAGTLTFELRTDSSTPVQQLSINISATDTLQSIINKINNLTYSIDTGLLTTNTNINENFVTTGGAPGGYCAFGYKVVTTGGISADVYNGNLRIRAVNPYEHEMNITIVGSSNFKDIFGIDAGATTFTAPSRSTSTAEYYNGTTAGKARTYGSATINSSVSTLAGLTNGQLKIYLKNTDTNSTVSGSTVYVNYTTSNWSTALSTLDKTFYYNTGESIHSFFNNPDNNDVSGATKYYYKERYTGYQEDGKFVIQCDHHVLGNVQVVVEDVTGNLAALTGLSSSSHSYSNSKTTGTNTDYNGITKGQASLTGSVDLKGVDKLAGVDDGKITVKVGGKVAGTFTYNGSSSGNSQVLVSNLVSAIDAMKYEYSTGKYVSSVNGIGANDDNDFNTGKLEDGTTQSSKVDSNGQIIYTAELQCSLVNGKIKITSDVYGTNEAITITDTGNLAQLVGLNAGSWSDKRTVQTNTDYNGITKGQASLTGSVNLNGVTDLAGQTAGVLTFKYAGLSTCLDDNSSVTTISYNANTSVSDIVAQINNLRYDYKTDKKVTKVNGFGADDDNNFNTGTLENGTTQASYVDSDGYIHYIGQFQARVDSTTGKIVITADSYKTSTTSQLITVTDTGNFARLTGLIAGSDANRRTDSTNTDYNGITKGQATLVNSATISSTTVKVAAGNTLTVKVGGIVAGTYTYGTSVDINDLVSKINNMSYDYKSGKNVTNANGVVGLNDNYDFITGKLEDGSTDNARVVGTEIVYKGELQASYNSSTGKITITSDVYGSNQAITIEDGGDLAKVLGFNAGTWTGDREDVLNRDWNGITRGQASLTSNVQLDTRSVTVAAGNTLTVKVGGKVAGTYTYQRNVDLNDLVAQINNMEYDYATGKYVTNANGVIGGNDDNEFNTGKLEDGTTQSSYVDASGQIHYKAQLQCSIVNNKIKITSDVYGTGEEITIEDGGDLGKILGFCGTEGYGNKWSGDRVDSLNSDWNGITRGQATLTSNVVLSSNSVTMAGGGTLTVKVGGKVAGTYTYGSTVNYADLISAIDAMKYDVATGKVVTLANGVIGANDDNNYNTGNLENNGEHGISGAGTAQASYIDASGQIHYTAQVQCSKVNNKIKITSDVYGTNEQITIEDTGDLGKILGFCGSDGYGNSWSGDREDSLNSDWNGITRGQATLTGSVNLNSVDDLAGVNGGTLTVKVGGKVAGTLTYGNDNVNSLISTLVNTIDGMSYDYYTGKNVTTANGVIGANDDNNYHTGNLENNGEHGATGAGTAQASRLVGTEIVYKAQLQCSIVNGKIVIKSDVYGTNEQITIEDTGNLAQLVGFNAGSWADSRNDELNYDFNGIRKDLTTLTGTVDLRDTTNYATMSETTSIAGQVAGTMTFGIYLQSDLTTGTLNPKAGATAQAGTVLTVSYGQDESIQSIVNKINNLQYDINTNRKVTTPFTNGMAVNDDNEFNTGKLEDGTTQSSYVDAQGNIHYIGQYRASIVNGHIVVEADTYALGGKSCVIIEDTGNFSKLTGLYHQKTTYNHSRTDSLNRDWNGITRGQASLTGSVNLNGVTDLTAQKDGVLTIHVGNYIAGFTNDNGRTYDTQLEYTAGTSVTDIINQINDMQFDVKTDKQVTTPFTKAGQIAREDDNEFNTGNLESTASTAGGTNQNVSYTGLYGDEITHQASYVDADGYIHYVAQLQAKVDSATGKIVITSDVYSTSASEITIDDTGNFTDLVGLNHYSVKFDDSRTNSTNADYNGIVRGQASLKGSVAGLTLSSVRPFQTSTDGKSSINTNRQFDVYVGEVKVGTVTYNQNTNIENVIQQIEAMQYDYATNKTVSTSFSNGISDNDDNEFNTGILERTHDLTESQALAQGYTIIRTADELKHISSTGKYILMGNVDMTAVADCKLNNNFSGELNGNGYSITGVHGNALFDTISGGTVKNLNIIGNVTNSTGMLASTANNSAIIENVHLSGSVKYSGSSASTGALIGSATSVTIKNCTALVNVTNSNSNNSVGGLIGTATNSAIQNCYAGGNIIGHNNVGGIVGTAQGSSISGSAFEGSLSSYTSGATGNSRGAIAGQLTSGGSVSNCKAVVEGQPNINVTGNGGSVSGSTVYWESNDQVNASDYGVMQASYVDGSGKIHYTAQLQAYLTSDGRLAITSDVYNTSAQAITLRNDTGSFVKLTGLANTGTTVTTTGVLINGDEGIYTYNGGTTPGLTANSDLAFVGGTGQKFTVTIDDGSRTDTNNTVELRTITYDVEVGEFDTVQTVLDKIVNQGKATIASRYTYNTSDSASDPLKHTESGYTVRPEDVYLEAYVENEQIVIKMDGKYGERIMFTNDSSQFVERTGLDTVTTTYDQTSVTHGQTTGYDRVTGSVNTITKDFVMSNLTNESFKISGGNGTYNVYLDKAHLAQVRGVSESSISENRWSIDEIMKTISIQTDGHYRAGIYNDAIFETNHHSDRNASGSYEYYGDYSGNTRTYNTVTHEFETTHAYENGQRTYQTIGNSDIKGQFFIESTDQTFTDISVTNSDFTRRMGLVASELVQGANEETFLGDHGYFTYQTDYISGLKPNSIISGIKDGQLTFTLHSLDATGQMGSIEYRPDTTYTIDIAYNDTVTSILNKMKQAVYKVEDETLEHSDATESNRIDRLNFYVDYNSSVDGGRIVLEMIGNYADSITFDADTSGIMQALGLDKMSHTYNANFNVTDISCGKSMLTGSVGSLSENRIFGNMKGGDMTITAGDVTKTINVASNDRIKDVIEKINEGGTFEAGLDSSGHLFVKTTGQNANSITITGSSEFAQLAGLKSGTWSYSADKENGHNDFTKITGSVYGLQTDQKFNNMTTGAFTISATGLTTATINVTQGITSVGDVIAQINASRDFAAELDEAGRLVISTKKSVGSSIVVNSGTTNYTAVVGLTAGTLGGNAVFSSGVNDVYSELKGSMTGLDASARVSAGDFIVSVKRNGETITQTFNLTGTETISDVAALISNSNLGISATFNSADNSMSLKSKTAGAVEISLKDGTSNFAELTGFTRNGAQAHASVIGSLSTLTSTNTVQSVQMLGFSAGTFDVELINTDGSVSDKVTINIAKNDTVDSIISKINNTKLGLTAGIDASGKLVIQRNACDTAGGIRIEKGSSDFTNKIGFTSGGQQIDTVSSAGTDATRTVLKSNAISAATAAYSLASLGVTDGTFEINGVTISVKAGESIASLLSKINATFSADDASGVYAEFTGGRIVLTGNSQIGGGIINIEAGSSNITEILGFTNVSALSQGAQSSGVNAIYTINGKRYESASNIVSLDDGANIVKTDSTDEVIRITLNEVGSGVIDIGKKSVTDAANKLASFVNSFNTMTTLSASSSLKNDAEFATLLASLMSSLTDKVGSYTQVGKEMAAMGLTIYTTKDSSGNEKVSIAFNKEKFINAYLNNPQKVLDVLIGNDSKPIDTTRAGSMTRLANTLNKANNYFTSSITSLNTQAQNLALQIAQNSAELNNITATLALGSSDTSFDDMSEYLAHLQEQYDSVNSLIKKLKSNYNQSITRLVLH